MRNKDLITKKIEQLDNALSNIASQISTGNDPRAAKESILQVKEKLQDMQTLINTESDSWN
jgi:hypothetical protein